MTLQIMMNVPSPSAPEHRRVRDHLTRALHSVRSASPIALSDRQRARRRAALRALGRYIVAGRYPVNRVAPSPTPVFVDEGGARCAVAALLESTGHHALVGRIARDHNLARIDDLRDDHELVAWLADHGLTLAEAARIQPMYAAHTEAHWQPTVSIVASVSGGAATDSGAQFALSPGVRVGVRRVITGSTDHGNSVYGSLALTAEYARTFVIGVGGAHNLGLTLHWEPDGNHSDVQWFLLGGPIASLDDDDAPGTGFGAQLGGGFGFRRRTVPLFFEGVVQTLGRDAGVTVRVGLNIGVVW